MLLYCKGCTTAYAVGLSRCPHCGGTKFSENPPEPAAEQAEAEPVGEAEAAEAEPKKRGGK